jgi:hypothetical protein
VEFQIHLVRIHLSSTLPVMPAPYTSAASALASPRFVVRVAIGVFLFLRSAIGVFLLSLCSPPLSVCNTGNKAGHMAQLAKLNC